MDTSQALSVGISHRPDASVYQTQQPGSLTVDAQGYQRGTPDEDSTHFLIIRFGFSFAR